MTFNVTSYRAKWDRAAELSNRVEAIVNAARLESRSLNTDEKAQIKSMTDDARALRDDIRSGDLERANQLDAMPPLTADDYRRVENKVPAHLQEKARAAVGPRYTDMFGHAAAQNPGAFENGADLYRAIMQREFGRFQAAVFGDDSDTTSGAAYLVPGQYSATIFDAALQMEVVRPRAAIYPMTTESLTIAGVSHGDGTTGAFGVKPQWTNAGEQISSQKPKVRAIMLNARKLASLVVLPNELLADAANLDRTLTRILADGLAFSLDEAYLTGDGVGKPLGILNSPALVTITKETSQVGGTINAANLGKMLARLPAKSVSKPETVWIASPSVMGQLLTTSVVSGAVEPILKDGTTPGSFTLMGHEFLVSEHLPEVGTTGDILLCDLSQYAIGMRQDLGVQFSGHIYFDYDETAFRALARTMGMGTWDAPYTPTAAGGSTLSPFVCIETRS